MADNSKRPAGVGAKNRRAANKRKNDANKAAHNRMAEWLARHGDKAPTLAVIHPGARPRRDPGRPYDEHP